MILAYIRRMSAAVFDACSPYFRRMFAICSPHSFIPLEKKGGGGVEDFGSRDIGGWLALISGFWGDLRKRGK